MSKTLLEVRGIEQDSSGHLSIKTLSQYLSQPHEMSQEARTRVQKHLVECGTCRDRYGNLQVPVAFRGKAS